MEKDKDIINQVTPFSPYLKLRSVALILSYIGVADEAMGLANLLSKTINTYLVEKYEQIIPYLVKW